MVTVAIRPNQANRLLSNTRCQEVQSSRHSTICLTTVYSRLRVRYFAGSIFLFLVYKIPKLVEIVLPVDVRQNDTTLRWRQLGNSGSSYDTWALNYITFEAASSLDAVNNAFFPTDFTALTPLG